ncbi:helix-turn-helix transcriptional regulator [Erythrobacter arachoides]|uniref:Helix-turn-helix transcriptional regulator n=1 Tax=Aurantiacibacter arachoides TaxID=1850444 RepID=A0A844ZZL2_9SPHN|nr:response regulator transcription factor [Aurantiacibacter arachoides]MXO92690.1 helix-turn-helix transcriptional regulator [Aurantiacibacter arachoides]GGD55215.1 helix-turn-helix transcriptional regulator [Aurantiacibacter arachoides]
MRGTLRPALAYGALTALAALLLAWLDWRHVTRDWSTQFYLVVVALVFAGLGLWLGNRLTPRTAALPFARNQRALASLGISPREVEVLDELAQGKANKVIARDLGISPNTVKTHVARLFEKLGAANRTEAIARARDLRLLP